MDSLFLHIVQFFQESRDILYVFTFIVASFLLLSGVDDLAVDLYYWFFYLFKPKRLNEFQSIPLEKLRTKPEKPIALFIPTWHEYNVIDLMLTRACETIEYEHYDIFVGVYPNDERTTQKVLAVAEKYPRVHAVVAGHNGPSTKAENLNEMHQGMLRWENTTGIRYDIIVMHDAEDVIHPLSFKCFNYFIPDFDMVQLPVFPLETPTRKVVHWTYCDEFAELHTKDLVARHIFSGFIPSAGVGTGYNRWVIEFVGTSFARNMFRKTSLTEDYDIALRLALGKANLLYLYRPFGTDAATRAYFPLTFSTAVRQKTRWLIGICLQGWRNYGWVGDYRFRFTLYRDRKTVITNLVNILAYVVLFYVILYEAVSKGLTAYGTLAPIVSKGSLLWYIVVVDTVLMFWRFMHRFLTVSRIYGRKAGLLSIPRLPVGNIVNFVAAIRAFKQYFLARVRKKKVVWDKTVHHYPSFDQGKPVISPTIERKTKFAGKIEVAIADEELPRPVRGGDGVATPVRHPSAPGTRAGKNNGRSQKKKR